MDPETGEWRANALANVIIAILSVVIFLIAVFYFYRLAEQAGPRKDGFGASTHGRAPSRCANPGNPNLHQLLG